MPRCANPRKSAQIRAIQEFCIFVSSKLTYEANFPTLNICRKSMKAQNGLKFPSELCFGIMNVTKDSYLLNSKVTFLRSGQNSAGICPFFLRCTCWRFCLQWFSTSKTTVNYCVSSRLQPMRPWGCFSRGWGCSSGLKLRSIELRARRL